MPTVGIIGAGTMGAGIAQVAAFAGWHVVLHDLNDAILQRSVEDILARFDRLVEKGRMTAADRDAAGKRLTPASSLGSFDACELVIEAVVEDFESKSRVMIDAVKVAPESAVFATNTSSLSVTKLGFAIGAPARTVGMHFFNPVPLMPLVEVIAGDDSSPSVVDRVFEIAKSWGKSPVRCKDTPGFIVNRVARGYYLEPLRMIGEGIAGVDEIDRVLTRLGGFKMGPFTLMDLIGIDVNYAVSCSVWEQFGRPARFKPHPIQEKLFRDGNFGRKSGRGAYLYDREYPIPALPLKRRTFEMPEALQQSIRRFCAGAAKEDGSFTEQYVFARTLAAIINEAALALDERIATPEDIDTAMKLGTNYPHGPLEWATQIGRHTCRQLLDQLDEFTEDGRFLPANWLRE